MEGQSGVNRSIIDELHSSDIQGNQMECESDVLEVSLMNFILRIYKKIKWKVKFVLLEVSVMNFILGIFREIKHEVNVVLLECNK